MNSSNYSAGALPLAMRDTALTVAGLHRDGRPKDLPDVFRQHCEKQIAALRDELTLSGFSQQVVNDALYAQCALLDETVLRCLKDGNREAWEHRPLQVAHFNSHDAGDELVCRIQAQLQSPKPEPMLLRVFHTVMLLGFQGKFVAPGKAAERSLLIQRISDRLHQCTGSTDNDDQADMMIRGGTPSRWSLRISPLAWVLLAGVTTIALYAGLQYWLSASIRALIQQ